ncbi:MAG TPA: aminomethyl-transferring glycine dehydrogenase subunit GcvPB, partial [Candidatus Rifleibacterium sp.]|nr:aminomethyl-transferring glycine dehydrogenase subunit GcvPB [Candidatus Rifleibacterium sp.]
MAEPLIFDLHKDGRRGYTLPVLDVPAVDAADHIPARFLRREMPLPSLSELEVVRHFTRLSRLNHSVDIGFYPLGSCTMKYNPKVNENMARLPGFANLHPQQPEETVQGALAMLKSLEDSLAEVTGMDAMTLQPAAGAQGEMTGLLIVKAYHKKKGNLKTKIMIPDSGHGTNPASCSMVGYEVINVKSNERGSIDIDDLKAKLSPDV